MFAFLLAFAAQAQAPAPAQPDWRTLPNSAEMRGSSYDAASVVRTGPVTRVRLRFNATGGYSITTVEMRCGNYDGRIVGMANYDTNGTELGRNDITTPYRAIVAGSFIEAVARELCGAGQGPATP